MTGSKFINGFAKPVKIRSNTWWFFEGFQDKADFPANFEDGTYHYWFFNFRIKIPNNTKIVVYRHLVIQVLSQLEKDDC